MIRIFTITAALFFCMCLGNVQAQDKGVKDRIYAIEYEVSIYQKKMKELEEQIRNFRLLEMKEEVSSQPLMLEQEWKKYADKMKKAEFYEEEVDRLNEEVRQIKHKLFALAAEINTLLQKQ